jgi:hypothetical protein
MMLSSSLLPLFFLLLSAGERPARMERPFSLTIQEKRFEEVVTPGADSTVPADFETDSSVWGRITVPDTPSGTVHTFTDSIAIATTQPFPFETFMSRDTLYYRAEGKPNIIGKRIDAITDSMLACVFEGPSLEISAVTGERAALDARDGAGSIVPRAISHIKPDCKSGEYSRLRLPLSLGFFFIGMPRPGTDSGYIWEELKPLPSYSGLLFFPDLVISLRIVRVTDEAVTVVLSSDTTFTTRKLTMPSGEQIDLLEDGIHIGGTVILDPSSGVPTTGELRIDETISYLRPRLSTLPASKRCSYLLRLKTQ